MLCSPLSESSEHYLFKCPLYNSIRQAFVHQFKLPPYIYSDRHRGLKDTKDKNKS